MMRRSGASSLGLLRASVAPVSTPPPSMEAVRVTAADVARLDVFQSILTTLNDPRASAANLARDVQKSPVLCARIEVVYRQCVGGTNAPRLVEQIARIGNRALEAVLLDMLEDVVILGTELRDPDCESGVFQPER